MDADLSVSDALIAKAASGSEKQPAARRAGWLMWTACWLYVILLLLAGLALPLGADRHWIGTLLEFGPRWVLLLPIVLIAAAALAWDRRAAWLAALALLIGLFVTDFRVPVGLVSASVPGPTISVMTLNTDGRADPGQVAALAASEGIDIVCLQECFLPDKWEAAFGDDWHFQHHNQFLIVSRYPLSTPEPLVLTDKAWHRCAVRCQVETPQGWVHLVNVHAGTPRKGLEAILHRQPDAILKLQEQTSKHAAEAVSIANWANELPGPVLVAGDFNRSASGAIYNQCWGPFANAFSQTGWGWGATFYTRWHGVRIDHVLASPEFQARKCWPAADVGSAHRPLIARMTVLEQSQATVDAHALSQESRTGILR